jgi:hypothetical protein
MEILDCLFVLPVQPRFDGLRRWRTEPNLQFLLIWATNASLELKDLKKSAFALLLELRQLAINDWR